MESSRPVNSIANSRNDKSHYNQMVDDGPTIASRVTHDPNDCGPHLLFNCKSRRVCTTWVVFCILGLAASTLTPFFYFHIFDQTHSGCTADSKTFFYDYRQLIRDSIVSGDWTEFDSTYTNCFDYRRYPRAVMIGNETHPNIHQLQVAGQDIDVEITLDTRMPIFSATKWVAGVFVLDFVDRGLISLQSKPCELVPSFRPCNASDFRSNVRPCFGSSCPELLVFSLLLSTATRFASVQHRRANLCTSAAAAAKSAGSSCGETGAVSSSSSSSAAAAASGCVQPGASSSEPASRSAEARAVRAAQRYARWRYHAARGGRSTPPSVPPLPPVQDELALQTFKFTPGRDPSKSRFLLLHRNPERSAGPQRRRGLGPLQRRRRCSPARPTPAGGLRCTSRKRDLNVFRPGGVAAR
jgi:hypothetical protein